MDSIDKQAGVQPGKAEASGKDHLIRYNSGEMQPVAQQRGEKAASEDRLVVLCDGVFAIAMTLLALDIRLPSGLPSTGPGFNEALLNLFSNQVLFYLITFLVIAGYWMQHRRLMQLVKRIDSRFIRLTFLFLAFVTFLPVASSIVGTYGNRRGAVIVYTLTFVGCGLSSLALWLYASWRFRLIGQETALEEIITRCINLVVVPVYFSLSLLLLFLPVQPADIFWSWLLLPLVISLFQRGRHGKLKRWISAQRWFARATQHSEQPHVEGEESSG